MYVFQLLMNSFMRKNYCVNLCVFSCKNAFIVRKSNKSRLPVVPPSHHYFTVYYISVRLSFILSPLFIISYFLSPLLPISFPFSFCYFSSPFSALFFFSVFSPFLSIAPHPFSLPLLVISFLLLLLFLASCFF